MSERKTTVHIDSVELSRQHEIMDRIRENNEMEYAKTGKKPSMHVLTFGCQQNNADSERIKGMLNQMGYQDAEKKEDADVIIVNTCCVRENAELKLYGHIGMLKHLKRSNPRLIIGVCGCMMQQEHAVEMIRTKYRYVDIIFGTHNLYKLPELLERSKNEKYTLIDILNTEGMIVEDIPVKREDKYKAWVTIMYGCNNFCSYCIVPYVRGRERSRKPQDILEEIKKLAEDGCKEVTLLGQNVNSYGKDLDAEVDFADLLRMVNDVPGIERIRFMTSHPKDISDKLIDTMRDCKKVCEQLHLPFQAGSNDILNKMNRKYTKESYLEKVNKAKLAMPDIALSTDVIVGFPGETEADFEETLDVIRQVEYDQAFMFIYSKRKGTPAAELTEQVNEEIKHKYFDRLVKLQNSISRRLNEAYMGRIVEILVEGPSKNDPEKLTGRSRTGKVVNFDGFDKTRRDTLIGSLVNVKITEVFSWFLNGTMTDK